MKLQISVVNKLFLRLCQFSEFYEITKFGSCLLSEYYKITFQKLTFPFIIKLKKRQESISVGNGPALSLAQSGGPAGRFSIFFCLVNEVETNF
jgi:hypothetical protein